MNESSAPDASPPFLGPDAACRLSEATYALLPLPFEPTVSWGTGTKNGPRALLEASEYVELYDEELDSEPWRAGICTLDPLNIQTDLTCLSGLENAAAPQAQADRAMLQALLEVEQRAEALYGSGHRVFALGGEHSLTPALVRAARRTWSGVGVVQFDAHADLREHYHGTRHSHACAMRRVLDTGAQTLALGLRSMTPEGGRLIREQKLPVLFADPALTDPQDLESQYRAALAALPDEIYLTFDVDWFDPSVLPATGTPEPGGGSWWQATNLLRILFEEKTVRAVDVVELAPIPGHPASDFMVAKLIYKMIGYWERTQST